MGKRNVDYVIFNRDGKKIKAQYRLGEDYPRFDNPGDPIMHKYSFYGYMELQHTEKWILRAYDATGKYLFRMKHSWLD